MTDFFGGFLDFDFDFDFSNQLLKSGIEGWKSKLFCSTLPWRMDRGNREERENEGGRERERKRGRKTI